MLQTLCTLVCNEHNIDKLWLEPTCTQIAWFLQNSLLNPVIPTKHSLMSLSLFVFSKFSCLYFNYLCPFLCLFYRTFLNIISLSLSLYVHPIPQEPLYFSFLEIQNFPFSLLLILLSSLFSIFHLLFSYQPSFYHNYKSKRSEAAIHTPELTPYPKPWQCFEYPSMINELDGVPHQA